MPCIGAAGRHPRHPGGGACVRNVSLDEKALPGRHPLPHCPAQEYARQFYARADDSYPYGLLYGGGGMLLACQVLGVLAIGAWVLAIMGPFFYLFKVGGPGGAAQALASHVMACSDRGRKHRVTCTAEHQFVPSSSCSRWVGQGRRAGAALLRLTTAFLNRCHHLGLVLYGQVLLWARALASWLLGGCCGRASRLACHVGRQLRGGGGAVGAGASLRRLHLRADVMLWRTHVRMCSSFA